MSRKLHIAIAVHGRFHAFDLARALAARSDVSVTLLTSYSAAECSKFGIDPAIVRSCSWHRWLARLCFRLLPQPLPRWLDAFVHESFGRWARNELERMNPLPDVIRIFSGVAEETLRSTKLSPCARLLTRGSSHIVAQHRLLEDEERRAGVSMDKPSAYMLAREQREYALADATIVLSSFARQTFLEAGRAPDKVWLLPNAVNLKWYGATPEVMTARRSRITSGKPLRILTVGAFSFRKGILDMAEVVRRSAGRFEFRFVGDLFGEGKALRAELSDRMEFRDRVPPDQLAAEYAWGDVFFFPTIEDGFPAVLSQALAGGLPALTTPNGSGPDVVQEGVNGWIVSARDAEAMMQRLDWCDAHRSELAACADAAAASAHSRTWDDVADDFVTGLRQRFVRRP